MLNFKVFKYIGDFFAGGTGGAGDGRYSDPTPDQSENIILLLFRSIDSVDVKMVSTGPPLLRLETTIDPVGNDKVGLCFRKELFRNLKRSKPMIISRTRIMMPKKAARSLIVRRAPALNAPLFCELSDVSDEL